MGRIGYNHNDLCRNRIKELMKEDPQYRERIQKHRRGVEGGELSNMERGQTTIDLVGVHKCEERQGNIRKAIQYVEMKMMKEASGDVSAQLDQTMLKMLLMNMDVAEVYSAPRVNKWQERLA